MEIKKKTAEMPLILLENLSFGYEDIPALEDINLSIYRGESVVLRGPNGCGKSTLLRLLNGLCFPVKGRYCFQGEEITRQRLADQRFAKKFHQRVGFIFQNAEVQLFTGSVEEEILFGPLQMGFSEEEARRRTADVMQMLGLEKLRQRPPYQLSGGEKRKTAIAAVLSMNPEVLVLDEPLSGLDPQSQKWLLSFLDSMHRAGKTLIFSTHNEALADSLGTCFVDMTEEHRIGEILRV